MNHAVQPRSPLQPLTAEINKLKTMLDAAVVTAAPAAQDGNDDIASTGAGIETPNTSSGHVDNKRSIEIVSALSVAIEGSAEPSGHAVW